MTYHYHCPRCGHHRECDTKADWLEAKHLHRPRVTAMGPRGKRWWRAPCPLVLMDTDTSAWTWCRPGLLP